MNIVLIVVDALRYDKLGCNGYRGNISPYIDRLASEGLSYRDAYCCINATEPSLTSILSGLMPYHHGMVKHGPKVTDVHIGRLKRKNIPWLPEILKNNGFTTIGVDWLGRWHRRGYDKYGVSKSKDKSMYKKRPIENAREVTDQAIKHFKDNKGKSVFMFVHYWDTHTPYDPKRGYPGKFEHDSNMSIDEMVAKIGNKKWKRYYRKCSEGLEHVGQLESQYDAEVHHVDENIGRLVANLPRDSLVIITGDHGESMTEHDIFFTHHGLYDCTIHVPLICWYSEDNERTVINGFVQHVDILPTILNMLGIGLPKRCDGRVHYNVAAIRDRVYVMETHTQKKEAWRIDTAKYICAESKEDATCEWCGVVHGGVKELYNLKQDPQEVDNLLVRP